MRNSPRICPDCGKEFSANYKVCSSCAKALWIYERPGKNARFTLGEIGERPLICFGVNSSTARPGDKNLDPTVKRVQLVSRREGFDGWIMLNLYAERNTDPNKMNKKLDPELHKNNLRHIQKVFRSNPGATVWAAWGGLIMKRPFLKECLKDIVGNVGADSASWVNRGDLLAEGHPHHPLYLRKDAKFDAFDIKNYIKNLFIGVSVI